MALKEQLERLVDEMVTKGVRYEDAHREFEKKFIALVLSKVEGNLGKAADLLGMHRNTLSRKITEYRLRGSVRSVQSGRIVAGRPQTDASVPSPGKVPHPMRVFSS